MRILLLGPPGGGKGTQGARLAERLGVPHIAAGDLLRAEVAGETPLGLRVAEYMRRGELVPDDLVVGAITAGLPGAGFILDGFPRTLAQARGIEFDAVVHLEVRAAELRRRLLARAVLEGRADDTPAVIANRLRVYAEATAPLIDLYRSHGLLVEVNGQRPVETVTDDVLAQLARRLSATKAS